MSTEHKSNTPLEIRDLWQTPKFVFDYYNSRFGFNLDVAASRENALCELFIDEYLNALNPETIKKYIGEETGVLSGSHEIKASVWCNPPYSNIMPWVDLCVNASNEYQIPVVMLIPADTSVKWFKKAFDNCTECHFISGRLSFINAETQKPVSGNNKGSVVFIFDPKSPVKQSVHLINRDDMK